jgi:hypothetical protein
MHGTCVFVLNIFGGRARRGGGCDVGCTGQSVLQEVGGEHTRGAEAAGGGAGGGGGGAAGAAAAAGAAGYVGAGARGGAAEDVGPEQEEAERGVRLTE